MFKKLNNKKGFTLMEMLIVVAIIAILVAIAIPTMTNALEQSRESADAANIRSCYAEVMTAELTEGAASFQTASHPANGVWVINSDMSSKISGVVSITQQKDGWQNAKITEIAGSKAADIAVKSKGSVTITYNEGDATCTITAG